MKKLPLRMRICPYIYVYILVVTIFLLSLSFLSGKFLEVTIPITVKIKNTDITEKINPWHDKSDDKWYFFIPSYADLDDIVLCSDEDNCYFQHSLIDGNRALNEIEIGTEYIFEQHILFFSKSAKVIFLKSANIPTMYISTAVGNMDAVYNDKSHKEPVMIKLFDETGAVEYSGNADDKIKGHGNSTWIRLDKKPFKLILSEKTSFLGMDDSLTWILLANGFDKTNLRNKLIYDFAKKLDSVKTPDCEYVDLYLNGEYNGLYLLTEQISTDNFIDDSNESILLELHGDDARLSIKDTFFPIELNRLMQIYFSEDLDDTSQIPIIQDTFKKICNILNEENTTDTLTDYIDIKTWTQRYLVDEFFLNIDMDAWSSFYWWNKNEQKLYAGPIWDYDLSIGIELIKKYFDSANYICQIHGLRKPYYSLLYNYPDFQSEIKKEYLSQFAPKAEDFLINHIDDLSEKINIANEINSIRWNKMFEKNFEQNTVTEQIEYIKSFCQGRLDFLNSLWSDTDTYYQVTYAYNKNDLPFIYTFVKENNQINEPARTGLTSDEFSDFQNWISADNDLPYDSKLPVTDNISLYATQKESQPLPNWKVLIKKIAPDRSIVFLELICAVFVVLYIILIYYDIKNNGGEKRDG